MTFAEYLAIDAVNWSRLKELRVSPKHYAHRVAVPLPDADFLRVGRATHTAVLEPDRFLLDYAVFTGKVRRGKDWDAFQLANAGRTVLTTAQYTTACAIRDAVRAHPVAARYLIEGKSEQVVTWTDDATGVPCKARIDYVARAIVDLKTSRTIDERRFGSIVARYGYASQLAHYQAGWKAVHGEELPCVIIAVENEPPHDVAVYLVGEDPLYAGQEEVAELMRRLVECRKSNEWRGRYPDALELQLPAWAFPEGDSSGVKWLLGDDEEGEEVIHGT